jgi:protein-tyrosine phosphatase
MTDFHAHVLPGMDDGARNAGEAAEMLRMLAEQGVGTVAATPHYYRSDETIDEFLGRRARALAELEAARGCSCEPRLLPGAEVAFFVGMSREEGVRELRIEGTEVILLEMPPGIWTSAAVNEVYQVAAALRLTPLIAHVERYTGSGRNAGALEDMISFGALIQSNAEYFIEHKTRRRALKRLKRGGIHVFGSDCHNLAGRAPNMGALGRLLRRKLRPEELRGLGETERRLLEGV